MDEIISGIVWQDDLFYQALITMHRRLALQPLVDSDSLSWLQNLYKHHPPRSTRVVVMCAYENYPHPQERIIGEWAVRVTS